MSDNEELACAFLIPDDGDTTYGEAARLLCDADKARLAAVIAREAQADLTRFAAIIGDALIWLARDRRDMADAIAERDELIAELAEEARS